MWNKKRSTSQHKATIGGTIKGMATFTHYIDGDRTQDRTRGMRKLLRVRWLANLDHLGNIVLKAIKY
ncbi:hypothetical protein PC116_g18960 [Phytophthora cactorum]|uniref:Uncharacterized protein n=1 Tax=Phytophthora cactorum TaxID=29920 RepID=A0A8T1F758_9STRA|nr:hypothetical protein Pcac1_g10139 [Phytophthora cactorum]KAG2802671.1 hypothetical protein PC111_g19006 [Phytophthora cactorum]KAG2813169.1 hypothetical protein PC112_g14860 [Phytophthora cactorum]KAG2965967.1 hypothetical protein PC118_g19431 [Phytophthora cactorum]KAG3134496.1 hypothetical protein C6341_g22130 [Phytophthora cactorum]